MTTNKCTTTRNTKNGKTIEVIVERGTWTEEIHLDGMATGTHKTHAVDRTTITLIDQSGKALVSTDWGIDTRSKINKEMAAKGAVAYIGSALVTQEIVDLAQDAIAEANAAAPKTSEQIEIENAEAAAQKARDEWQNSAEQKAARKFSREMDRADSDY